MRRTPFSANRSRRKSAVSFPIRSTLPRAAIAKPRIGSYYDKLTIRTGCLRAKNSAARAGEEPGLEQERHDLRLADRLAVEAFDSQALGASALHVRHQ